MLLAIAGGIVLAVLILRYWLWLLVGAVGLLLLGILLTLDGAAWLRLSAILMIYGLLYYSRIDTT
jgi:hypothetical protein